VTDAASSPSIGERPRPTLARWCRVGVVLVVAVWFASFYRPGFGFTAVLLFNQHTADTRVEAMRDVPVYVPPGVGYDGQYYVQLAVDPLLREPSIDRALDSPPFRARRILFAWTAWVLGFGRPAWVVEAYCVQNLLFWLLFAIWLRRRLRADTVQDLLVWCACVLTPGLLDSMRMGLVDGPSLLIVALGVESIERGRLWTGALTLGVAGLGRETNLLAAAALVPRRWRWREFGRAAGAGLLVLLPTLIWFDYLRSIYRSTVTQALDQLAAPVVSYANAWHRVFHAADRAGWLSVDSLPLLAVAGITAQGVHLLTIRTGRGAWWRAGLAFLGLMLLIRGEIWLGAYARVLLPLTLAFNLSVPRGRQFWTIFTLGNLGLATSLSLLTAPLR
jgi:hypothetical protein